MHLHMHIHVHVHVFCVRRNFKIWLLFILVCPPFPALNMLHVCGIAPLPLLSCASVPYPIQRSTRIWRTPPNQTYVDLAVICYMSYPTAAPLSCCACLGPMPLQSVTPAYPYIWGVNLLQKKGSHRISWPGDFWSSGFLLLPVTVWRYMFMFSVGRWTSSYERYSTKKRRAHHCRCLQTQIDIWNK